MIYLIRKIKKVATLFFVVLFCFNSFAVTVSDNDGSAFITKAEFDSLKNNFQSQIDAYHSNIDNKIDGAIAAYLTGVKIEVSTTLNTALKDWDEVTMRNYELKNSYAVPGCNINFSYYATGHSNATNYERYPSAYGLAVVGKNSSSKASLKSVGLISGDEENYNDLTKNKFYWTGYITDYEEQISLSKLGYNNYQDVVSAMSNISLKVYDTVKLSDIENKYYSSITNFWSTIWKPLINGTWSTGSSNSDVAWTPTFAGGFSQWGSKYKNDNIKNKYELTWAAVDENVINPDFKNCFYKFADNAKNSKDMLDAMSKNSAGTWLKANSNGAIPNSASGTRTATGWDSGTEGTSWRRVYLESHYNPSAISANIYDYTRGATSSAGRYKIPTLGGLGPISSDRIYLQKKNLTYTFKNTEYTKDVTTMNDGFPLLFAKKNAILTWECVFTDVKGSTAIENNGEAKIVLSYGQFNDESESKSGKYVQEDGTSGNTEYVWTTKNKTCKIKWTMQEDGWIYAKWFPAVLTSSTAKSAVNWYVTLDGNKSNKVIFADKS